MNIAKTSFKTNFKPDFKPYFNNPPFYRFLQHTISIIKDKKSQKHHESLLPKNTDYLESSKNLQSKSQKQIFNFSSNTNSRPTSPEPPETNPGPPTDTVSQSPIVLNNQYHQQLNRSPNYSTENTSYARGDCPTLQNTSKSSENSLNINNQDLQRTSEEKWSYEKAVSQYHSRTSNNNSVINHSSSSNNPVQSTSLSKYKSFQKQYPENEQQKQNFNTSGQTAQISTATSSTCSTPTITTYSASSLSSLTTTTSMVSNQQSSRFTANPNAQIYG